MVVPADIRAHVVKNGRPACTQRVKIAVPAFFACEMAGQHALAGTVGVALSFGGGQPCGERFGKARAQRVREGRNRLLAGGIIADIEAERAEIELPAPPFLRNGLWRGKLVGDAANIFTQRAGSARRGWRAFFIPRAGLWLRGSGTVFGVLDSRLDQLAARRFLDIAR